MLKQLLMLVTAVAALALAPITVAGPPEGKGADKGMKGKAEKRERGDRDRMKESDDADEREEEAREKAGEEREEAREREEDAREREEEAREDEDEDDDEGKPADKGKKDMPPGLKKKDAAPQAGKGSETGQQKREENSKAWWKFWGDDEE